MELTFDMAIKAREEALRNAAMKVQGVDDKEYRYREMLVYNADTAMKSAADSLSVAEVLRLVPPTCFDDKELLLDTLVNIVKDKAKKQFIRLATDSESIKDKL